MFDALKYTYRVSLLSLLIQKVNYLIRKCGDYGGGFHLSTQTLFTLFIYKP